MPKRSTGYTPDRSKTSPVEKEAQPLKMPNPSKGTGLPTPLAGTNNVAKLGKGRQRNNFGPKIGGLGRPSALPPKTPRI